MHHDKTKLQKRQTPPQPKIGEVQQKPNTIKDQIIILATEEGSAINLDLKYELIYLTNDDSPLRTTYTYVMSHVLEGSTDQPTTSDIPTCSVTVFGAITLVQKIGNIEINIPREIEEPKIKD